MWTFLLNHEQFLDTDNPSHHQNYVSVVQCIASKNVMGGHLAFSISDHAGGRLVQRAVKGLDIGAAVWEAYATLKESSAKEIVRRYKVDLPFLLPVPAADGYFICTPMLVDWEGHKDLIVMASTFIDEDLRLDEQEFVKKAQEDDDDDVPFGVCSVTCTDE